MKRSWRNMKCASHMKTPLANEECLVAQLRNALLHFIRKSNNLHRLPSGNLLHICVANTSFTKLTKYAIKIQDKTPLLIECKAIALDLKDDYVRQATNYAADSGIEWVILTNGILWKIYHITFGKPIDKELIYEFNLCEVNLKKQSDIEMLYYLCIEAFAKNSKATLEDFRAQKKILNRFTIGQIILTEAGIDNVRKCIRKLYPDLKVTNDEIHSIVFNEIFKREVVDSDDATEAKKAIVKQEKKISTAKAKKQQD